jgi:hypothetical protein
LCDFLGVEEPDEPFPRTNDTAQMRRRLQGVKAISLAVPAALTLLVGALLVLLRRRARDRGKSPASSQSLQGDTNGIF